jgi:hypothetical protein
VRPIHYCAECNRAASGVGRTRRGASTRWGERSGRSSLSWVASTSGSLKGRQVEPHWAEDGDGGGDVQGIVKKVWLMEVAVGILVITQGSGTRVSGALLWRTTAALLGLLLAAAPSASRKVYRDHGGMETPGDSLLDRLSVGWSLEVGSGRRGRGGGTHRSAPRSPVSVSRTSKCFPLAVSANDC